MLAGRPTKSIGEFVDRAFRHARAIMSASPGLLSANSQPQTPTHVEVVEALYDYFSEEPSALQFCKGDFISVLHKLDSGWWDGVLLVNDSSASAHIAFSGRRFSVATVRGWYVHNVISI